MTGILSGASSGNVNWETIDWVRVTAQVCRLQMRIAKATREGRYGKVKALQWLLTHSSAAKLLAVRRVVQNKGGKTPGVDGTIWITSQQRMQAANSLNRRGYKPLPLKRIYIPKSKGRMRPLSIPVMGCRGMQALHLLALEPVAETLADKNSYGFRPKRSAADAMVQCWYGLSRPNSAQWILEADIESCFDKISHSWLMDNIPMDKVILQKWLQAGYIDQKVYHQTTEGTPQGSIISPTLLNLTLRGLEDAIASITSKREDRVHLIIYADDFVITGVSKEVLEEIVKPKVEAFLNERGLRLSQEKTKITHIDDGFDFLGATMRKYKGKFLTIPAKKGIKTFLAKIRKVIKRNPQAKTETLIRQLNPMILGWANYFRHTCASRTFSYIDNCIFKALWSCVGRRHPTKNLTWRKQKYFRSYKERNWIFSTKIQKKSGIKTYLDLILASSRRIERHVKIIAEATPFDPKFLEYFQARASKGTSIKRETTHSLNVQEVAGLQDLMTA